MSRVSQPIFIVGSGRSGTTLVYELMCQHPDLAWFSNYVDRCPRLPQLAVLSRFANRPNFEGWKPRPVEGYRIWDFCRSMKRPNEGPLGPEDVHDAERQCINKIIAQIVAYQGKQRFINKNTRNSVRIRFLLEILDDPVFIHVTRHPRAAVASLTRVSFWPELRVWCRGGTTPREWQALGMDPVSLGADLWRHEVSQVMADRGAVPIERFMQVRYEDLVAEPRKTALELMRFCELPIEPDVLNYAEATKIDNRNQKYRSQLTVGQIEEIDRITRPVAAALGYDE